MTNEELAVRIRAGVDVPENMLQLWQQVKAFIHTMALHYRGYADLEDLEQEGYLALYDAVDGYDPEGGSVFLSYASFWIRQRMKRYIDNCCQAVRIPVNGQARLHRYRKLENAFRVCHGRKPNRREVAYNMDLEESQVIDLETVRRMAQVGSLDCALTEEDGGAAVLGDMVPCDLDVEQDVIDRLDQQRLREVLWPMVDRLPGRQPDVIRMRYQQNKTLREIGEAYGVAIEAVRQAEQQGMRALRRSGSRTLRAFLPEQVEAEVYRHCGAEEFDRTWTSSTERAALKLAR